MYLSKNSAKSVSDLLGDVAKDAADRQTDRAENIIFFFGESTVQPKRQHLMRYVIVTVWSDDIRYQNWKTGFKTSIFKFLNVEKM